MERRGAEPVFPDGGHPDAVQDADFPDEDRVCRGEEPGAARDGEPVSARPDAEASALPDGVQGPDDEDAAQGAAPAFRGGGPEEAEGEAEPHPHEEAAEEPSYRQRSDRPANKERYVCS